MKPSGPGRSYRKGIDIFEAARRFGDETEAHDWFVARRWPNGVRCIDCDSDRVATRKPNARRKTPVFHCNECKKDFTVKTGTIMHDSRLPLHKWAMAFYLFSTELKGVSSMKLHRALRITQKSAWHMAHRIRETWEHAGDTERFTGTVEMDETFIGGLERNKHENKKLKLGRGPVGKTPVIGMKDRDTKLVAATPVNRLDHQTLRSFINLHTEPGGTIYTDESSLYNGLHHLTHKAVRHRDKEYVRGDVHTNGVEGFWSMIKRGVYGTYHHVSPEHLHRYVTEFEGRHNARPLDTEDQMTLMAMGAEGKRLRYRDLIDS